MHHTLMMVASSGGCSSVGGSSSDVYEFDMMALMMISGTPVFEFFCLRFCFL